MDTFEEKKGTLKKIIQKDGILTSDKHLIISTRGNESKGGWIFDLRNVFMNPASLDLIADIFWKKFSSLYPFQVGGQEIAAIPLVTAILLKGQTLGKPTNGFIIRKNRKPTGLQRIVEGELNSERIILVDDLMNSGTAIFRQLKVLEEIDRKADLVFVLVNFREKTNSERVAEKDLKLDFLFTLKDFGLNNAPTNVLPKQNFDIIWKFKSPHPNLFNRVPKSTPCLDKDKLYFGSDCDYFWALSQNDGSIIWKFEVGLARAFRKSILSSPVLFGDLVYFGAYDGNVYALNKNTGKVRWKYEEADYVGSSPAVAPDLNLLFIGLEFGLFRKQGGIAALDLKTGKEVWKYAMEEYVHSSPVYCPEKGTVAIGCNDFCVYLFDAKNGRLKWKYKTKGPIKASFSFDTARNLLIFGSFDKNIYALDLDSGKLKGKFETKEVIFSTPKSYGDYVYFSSADKNIYCLSLVTGRLIWKFTTGGRSFSSPEIIEGKVIVGSNDGRAYELDAKTGKCLSFFQTTERITNPIAYNPQTKRYFVTTYANEIYCLQKKSATGLEQTR